MKTMKKITTLMLTICILATCFTMSVFAADGKIMFEDPTTTAGETFSVKGVVEKTSGNFGKIEITMKYDTNLLDFQSGTDVTETQSGVLVYKGDATNDTGSRKEFTLKFKALAEGTATIKIQDSTIKNVSGTVLDYTEGSSKITIKAGNGTVTDTPDDTPDDTPSNIVSDGTVEVLGKKYSFAEVVPENEIPEGYEAHVLEYGDKEYKAVYNSDFALTLVYLIDEEYAGDFFMYVESDATFAPYEEIQISDTSANSVKIVLLSDISEIILPEQFVEDTTEVNGITFPIWRDTENPEYYIFYALNNHGEKNLYQYDTNEGTYQKFIAPEIVQEKEDKTFLGKVSSALENHLDQVILVGGIGVLVLLLVIVILSVKLYNRNAELDEIYDEYGIGDEEKTEDDVMFELDEDEYEDYDDENEELSKEELAEASLFVKEGMKEITEDELKAFVTQMNKETKAKPSMEDEETLGKALEEVVAQQGKQEEYYDDDEIFENFSVDFIDLDD